MEIDDADEAAFNIVYEHSGCVIHRIGLTSYDFLVFNLKPSGHIGDILR